MRSLKICCFVAAFVLAAAAGFSPAPAQELVAPAGSAIQLDMGKGTLLRLDRDADTVFVADPDIADAMVKTSRLIYLYGKAPGETSLYAVDKAQQVITNRAVVVKRDVARLQAAINQLVPDSMVDVRAVDATVVLTGHVDTPGDAEEIRRIARPYVADDKDLINHVSVDAPNEVNLRVRVAEVQHNIIKELGINWQAVGYLGNAAIGLVTGVPTLATGPATGVLAPFPQTLQPLQGNLNPGASFAPRNPGIGGTPTNSGLIGVNTNSFNINNVIDALDQNGLVNILAEPNLTTMSGETASFLAGGEFPILVPQGTQGITIEFKPFGVALAFTPVILQGNRISIRVRPEVSQISTTGQVEVSGFVVPALSTRRAETTIELGSGQSFAIGGLLQNNITDTLNKVPGLGELPVLGGLFRSSAFQRNETELVILVTPYLVKPVSDKRLQTPRDGYTPPNDLDLVYRGRDERPSEPEAGKKPVGPDGNALVGPAGFVLN